MGLLNLFGGDSQSAQTTNNTDQSQAQSASTQAGGDLLQLAPSINLQGSGSSLGSLQLSDYGAIAGAQDLLKSGLSDIVSTAQKQAAASDDAVKNALALAGKTSATSGQTFGDTLVSVVKWGALAIGAIWLLGGFKKGRLAGAN